VEWAEITKESTSVPSFPLTFIQPRPRSWLRFLDIDTHFQNIYKASASFIQNLGQDLSCLHTQGPSFSFHVTLSTSSNDKQLSINIPPALALFLASDWLGEHQCHCQGKYYIMIYMLQWHTIDNSSFLVPTIIQPPRGRRTFTYPNNNRSLGPPMLFSTSV